MQSEEVVRAFFVAYQQHDYERMRALLSDEVRFADFAFNIHGQDVFAMWQLFCLATDSRAPVDVHWFKIIRANGDAVTADYRVAYLYGEEKRSVDYCESRNAVLAFSSGPMMSGRLHATPIRSLRLLGNVTDLRLKFGVTATPLA